MVLMVRDNRKAIGIVTAQEGREDCYLALDYDNCKHSEAEADALEVMERFRLGDFITAKTGRKKYHAVFPYEMLNWMEVLDILKSSRLCDRDFIRQAELKGYLRIRVFGKRKEGIKIVGIIESPYFNTNEAMGAFRIAHYKRMLEKLGQNHG